MQCYAQGNLLMATLTDLSIEFTADWKSLRNPLTTTPAATGAGRPHASANRKYRSSCQSFFEICVLFSVNSNKILLFLLDRDFIPGRCLFVEGKYVSFVALNHVDKNILQISSLCELNAEIHLEIGTTLAFFQCGVYA